MLTLKAMFPSFFNKHQLSNNTFFQSAIGSLQLQAAKIAHLKEMAREKEAIRQVGFFCLYGFHI